MVVSVATLAKLRKRNLGCRTMASSTLVILFFKMVKIFKTYFFPKKQNFVERERERERESFKLFYFFKMKI